MSTVLSQRDTVELDQVIALIKHKSHNGGVEAHICPPNRGEIRVRITTCTEKRAQKGSDKIMLIFGLCGANHKHRGWSGVKSAITVKLLGSNCVLLVSESDDPLRLRL